MLRSSFLSTTAKFHADAFIALSGTNVRLVDCEQHQALSCNCARAPNQIRSFIYVDTIDRGFRMPYDGDIPSKVVMTNSFQ